MKLYYNCHNNYNNFEIKCLNCVSLNISKIHNDDHFFLPNESNISKEMFDKFIMSNESNVSFEMFDKFVLPNELYEYIKKYSSCRIRRILHQLSKNLGEIYLYHFGSKIIRLNNISYKIYHLQNRTIKDMDDSSNDIQTQLLYNEINKYAIIYCKKLSEHNNCMSWFSCYYYTKLHKLYALTYVPFILLKIICEVDVKFKNKIDYEFGFFDSDHQIRIMRKYLQPLFKILIDSHYNYLIKIDTDLPIASSSAIRDRNLCIYFPTDLNKFLTDFGKYYVNSKNVIKHMSFNKHFVECLINYHGISIDISYFEHKFVNRKKEYTIFSSKRKSEKIIDKEKIFLISHSYFH